MTAVDWAAMEGALLLFRVRGETVVEHAEHGRVSAVVADVHILDGEKEGEVYTGTLVFPKVLQSQLKPTIGQQVAGRLGQGHGKPHQPPPWTLSPATGEDKVLLVEWLGRHGGQG